MPTLRPLRYADNIPFIRRGVNIIRRGVYITNEMPVREGIVIKDEFIKKVLKVLDKYSYLVAYEDIKKDIESL